MRIGHFASFVGTEELGHLEMIGTIVHQLTRNLSEKDIKTAGFDAYFVDHTTGVYPTAASGFPWNAASMAVKGDVIADLTEDPERSFISSASVRGCALPKKKWIRRTCISPTPLLINKRNRGSEPLESL